MRSRTAGARYRAGGAAGWRSGADPGPLALRPRCSCRTFLAQTGPNELHQKYSYHRLRATMAPSAQTKKLILDGSLFVLSQVAFYYAFKASPPSRPSSQRKTTSS